MPEDNPIVPAPRGDLTTSGGSNPILDKMVRDALELAKASTELDERKTDIVETGNELAEDAQVELKCPNMEKAVREALEKPEGEITRGDMLGLDGFSVDTEDLEDSEKVTDLSGLEHAVNLTDLGLGSNSNQITDISPLQGLTNLTYLGLVDTQISDISPLQGLTNLTYLGLEGNQITDISPLQGLTNLTELFLFGNQITDLSPLQELTNLTNLYLESNQIHQSQQDDLQRALPNCKIYDHA
jgi:hypothetical protein